jgi:hypothetical protein
VRFGNPPRPQNKLGWERVPLPGASGEENDLSGLYLSSQGGIALGLRSQFGEAGALYPFIKPKESIYSLFDIPLP